MSLLLLQCRGKKKKFSRACVGCRQMAWHGGVLLNRKHWTRTVCSSTQILLTRISTSLGPPKRRRSLENAWKWWQCYCRSGEMDASTKFKVVQDGDRSSRFSPVHGCWGGWRHAEKRGAQHIPLVILRVCSKNYTISYKYQKIMLHTFLDNLPIYPPTCLNYDSDAQSSSLVKGTVWNWKIIWNIPQLSPPPPTN